MVKTVLGLFSYGGVMEATVDSVLAELGHASQHGHPMMYHRISGDALIERSRSRALGQFMASDADVLVMIDHDITWRPGDANHIAAKAHKERALVGGLYCKRAMGKGWSSRVPIKGQVEFGKDDRLLETPALATGFLAIPRSVIDGMEARLDITRPMWKEEYEKAINENDGAKAAQLLDMSIAPIEDGAYRKVEFKYKDYFRCIRFPASRPDVFQFLSEDWAFSMRAVFCGYKSYISTFPVLGHTGDYRYLVSDGMDAKDLEEHGEKREHRDADDKDQGPGGDTGVVRNECDPSVGDRSESSGTSGEAS